MKPDDKLPFEVPLTNTMLMRLPGKVPNTVLTVEAMIYTWRICEYTEPLGYGRHWCYERVSEALTALLVYRQDESPEPDGWLRAGDVIEDDGYRQTRKRRARVVDGKRHVYEDGEL